MAGRPSYAQIARDTGLGDTMVSGFFRGATNPHMRNLARLMEHFGVRLVYREWTGASYRDVIEHAGGFNHRPWSQIFRAAGIDPADGSRWRTGQSDMLYQSLQRLMRVLNVMAAYPESQPAEQA